MQLAALKNALKRSQQFQPSVEGDDGYAAHSFCSFATSMNALRTQHASFIYVHDLKIRPDPNR